jgi:hypothetical protein
MATAATGLPTESDRGVVVAAPNGAGGPDGEAELEPELELDEDFLRRIREV